MLLVRLGPNSDQLKSLIEANISKFKKNVRKTIKAARRGEGLERRFTVDEPVGCELVIKLSRSIDLLFDTGDAETKCPWAEIPYTCLEVECPSVGSASDESHPTPLMRDSNVSEAQVDEIYNRLSKIETVLHMAEEASVPPKPKDIHAAEKIILKVPIQTKSQISGVSSGPRESPKKPTLSAEQPHSSKSPKSTNCIQQVTPVKASTTKTPVVVRRAMEENAAVTKVPSNSLNELSKASPKSAIAAQKSTAALQAEATHPSSGGQPKTSSKTRSGTHHLNVSTAQTPKKNDAYLASHPSTATEPAALPPKGRQPAITPAANLEHLGRIIDSVVAGLDDYSASQYTPNDYVIEPPRASVTELSFRDFEKLEVAMKHEKERRSNKRPPASVDVDEAGDASPDDIFSQSQEEPARRKKKSKVRRSSEFDEEFTSVVDETIANEDNNVISQVHKKHSKHHRSQHE